jgi:FkbM family methyltransferase
MKVALLISDLLGHRGFVIRRSDAYRRASLFRHHGVDLILDVGAASGKYVLDLRKQGFTGTAISYEPLHSQFVKLSANASKDPRWTAVQTAVGSERATLSMNVSASADSSSLLPMHDLHGRAAPDAKYVGSETVQVERLDLLARGAVDRATAPFLKIDALAPLYQDGMLFQEALNLVREAGFALQGVEPGFRESSSQRLLQFDGIFFRE